MKKKTYILLLFFCILAGCERNGDLPDDTVPVSFRRTVLVYLGVDNNFRAEAAQKIETLTTNWNKNNDGNLLVYSDAGGNCPRFGHSKLLYFAKKVGFCRKKKSLKSLNFRDFPFLKSF